MGLERSMLPAIAESVRYASTGVADAETALRAE